MTDTARVEKALTEDRWVKSFCHGCLSATCSILVHVVDGVVVELQGDPDNPFNKGKVCSRSMAQIMTLYNPYRPRKPLVRTNPNKGKGVDPQWREVEWEEALDLAAQKLVEYREKHADATLFSSTDITALFWNAMPVAASFGMAGTQFTNPVCANAVHCQPYQTMGSFHQYPDFAHCRHLVLWGSEKGGMTQHAGVGAAFDVAEMRTRHKARLISITPHMTNIAAKADEWVPIRPGTDMALALAWLNVLLNECGLYDVEYLKRWTNSPYLVREDGRYLRDPTSHKPMLWNSVAGEARSFDAGWQDAALEGSYEVAGTRCKTAFQLLKDHVRQYSPEWASPLTTIPSDTIRRLAREFGEAAQIGSTIDIEGQRLPYRPAALHWYAGISQHNNGYMTGFALETICLVVGAVNVPGGTVSDGGIVEYPYLPTERRTLWSAKDGYPGQSDEGIIMPSGFQSFGRALRTGYPARDPAPLKGTGMQLFPASFGAQGVLEINNLDPGRFNHKWPRLKMIIGRQCSDLSNNMNSDETARARRDVFQISIEPLVDETAEFADIFFPHPTRLERTQLGSEPNGYMGATINLEYNCLNYSQPVVPADRVIGREMLDIWTELAERAGFLRELNRAINIGLDLPEKYQLEPDRKYTYLEMLDRFAQGVFGRDQRTLSQEGHIKWRKSVRERYPRPFSEGRALIYYEHLLDAGEKLGRYTREVLGFEWDVSEYRALPFWRPTAAYTDMKPGFDLIAIPFRLPMLSHFWTTHNPWQVEMAERHPWGMNIVMNRKTAQARGIRHGDRITVESVPGYRVTGEVRLTECIHPEVVAVSRHGGHWCANPVAKGKGTLFNTLVPHKTEYMDPIFSGLENCIRVRVNKAA